MRQSNDQYKNGFVWNGFDYSKQCWVENGIIQRCGHPETMSCLCFGRDNEGKSITDFPKA